MNGLQVPTMARENSGTAPKLRTYGRIRGYTLQRNTNEHGGATLDLSSDTMDLAMHKTGYYVGGYGKVHSFPVITDVRPYIEAIREVYVTSSGSGLVGTWVHAGMVYAERSAYFTCRTRAMLAARKLGQMEIFDIEAGKSIPVPVDQFPKWGYPNAD